MLVVVAWAIGHTSALLRKAGRKETLWLYPPAVVEEAEAAVVVEEVEVAAAAVEAEAPTIWRRERSREWEEAAAVAGGWRRLRRTAARTGRRETPSGFAGVQQAHGWYRRKASD